MGEIKDRKEEKRERSQREQIAVQSYGTGTMENGR